MDAPRDSRAQLQPAEGFWVSGAVCGPSDTVRATSLPKPWIWAALSHSLPPPPASVSCLIFSEAAKMQEMSSEWGLWLYPAPGRAAVPAWLAHGQEFIEILSSTGSSSLIKMPSYKLCFYKAYKIHPGSGLGIPTGPICCCLFIFLLIYQKSNRHRVLPLPCCCFIIEGGSSPPSPYLQAIRCCFKKNSSGKIDFSRLS